MLTRALAVHADAKIVWLVNFRYSRRKFGQGGELINGLVFPRGSNGRVCCYRSVDSGEWGEGGFCEGCRDRVCRAVVGAHGDVLPKSIVLFSEVCREKEKRVRQKTKEGEKRKTSLVQRSPSPRLRLADRRIGRIGRHRRDRTMVLLLRRWPSLLGRCMRDRSLPDHPQDSRRGLVVEERMT